MTTRPSASRAPSVFIRPPARKAQVAYTRPTAERVSAKPKRSTVPSVRLLSLPPELLCEVASYLDERTTIRLRQVCRELEAATCDHFARLFFSDNEYLFTKHSLTRLVEITSQPRFVKAITGITLVPLHMHGTSVDTKLIPWSSNVAPLAIEDYEWDETGNEDLEYTLGPEAGGNEDYGQDYVDDYQSSERLGMAFFGHDNGDTIDGTFEYLDDLDDDEVEELGPIAKPKQQWQALKLTEAKGNWLNAEHELHHGALDVELLVKIFNNLSASGNKARFTVDPVEGPELCYGGPALIELLGCRAAMHYITSKVSPSHVLQALHQASARSQQGLWLLYTWAYQLNELGSEAFCMPSDLLESPWSRLKDVRLDLEGFQDCSNDGTHDGLANLLQSAVVLDTLVLRFPSSLVHESRNALELIVRSLPPSTPLRRLSLASSNGPKDLLLPFLLRYTTTLTTLRLEDVAFSTEDDWIELVDALANDFRLKYLELFSLRIPNVVEPTHLLQYKDESELTFSGVEHFPQNMSSLRETGQFVSIEEDSEGDDVSDADEDEDEDEDEDDDGDESEDEDQDGNPNQGQVGGNSDESAGENEDNVEPDAIAAEQEGNDNTTT